MPTVPSTRRSDLVWSRRDLLKQSGLVSAAAATAALTPALASAETKLTVKELIARGTPTDNLFTQIGVRPIVNARGTYTIISGSCSLPEVKQAMFEASQYYVQMDEMMAGVGAEIAKLMGSPSAIVTCGCEAAIALATVACMCGTDPELSQSYPYHKAKSQVIIPKYSRNQYDFGIRMSGPEIVEVESDEELRAKLSDQVAMIYLFSGPRAFEEPLSIKTVCALAKEKGVPVFVDAAAEEPRVPNIHLAAGATFVGYSGGKCMRGPQAAGVLLGPKDLCAAAFWNAAPHHNWGRALKVGKEEAMGMLAAVRQWYKRDHDAEQKQWMEWMQYTAGTLKGIPSLTTKIDGPDADLSNRAPVLTVNWDAAQVGITGPELVKKLDEGTPRILIPAGTGRRPEQMQSSVSIMPYMMQPGDYKVVADALSRALRHPGQFENPPSYPGAAAQLNGTWNVTVQYTRGVGRQRLTLMQNGNELQGELHGQLMTASVKGQVNADHVTLQSTLQGYASSVPFNFSGVVTGDTFKGDLKLGEYGAATFSAVRA